MINLEEIPEVPEVTRFGIFSIQVCVPKKWDDKQIVAFAEKEYPCGTTNGWFIRKEGHELLRGDPERVACLKPSRNAAFVHVMLDA